MAAINGTPGHDSKLGTGGNDTITLFAGNDQAYGGDGRDSLYGGNGNDLLSGGGLDDLLVAGLGNDTLWGGAGHDSLNDGAGHAAPAGHHQHRQRRIDRFHAIEQLEAAYGEMDALGDEEGRTLVAFNLAFVHALVGQAESSRRYLEIAARRYGGDWEVVWIEARLAWLAGDRARARSLHERSRQLAKSSIWPNEGRPAACCPARCVAASWLACSRVSRTKKIESSRPATAKAVPR